MKKVKRKKRKPVVKSYAQQLAERSKGRLGTQSDPHWHTNWLWGK